MAFPQAYPVLTLDPLQTMGLHLKDIDLVFRESPSVLKQCRVRKIGSLQTIMRSWRRRNSNLRRQPELAMDCVIELRCEKCYWGKCRVLALVVLDLSICVENCLWPSLDKYQTITCLSSLTRDKCM